VTVPPDPLPSSGNMFPEEEGAPLPSASPPPLTRLTAPDDDGDDDEEDDDDEEPQPAPRPRPPAPQFKVSTFLYVFLGILGLLMILYPANAFRNPIAGALGTSPSHPGPLYALIGFGSSYLLLSMALAGAIEMLVTSLAYNFTTDWVKAAKVQKWSAAFRKVQMAALRSGKKDRIAALKPHQERLARLSGEVSIAQFKGMAITYFLLILIYTWVGLTIAAASTAQQTISFGGASIVLTGRVLANLPLPWWFLIFSLYTVPFSLVFRRVLKQLWLRRYVRDHPLTGVPATGAAGGSA
jgi:uncharacterized membrane protein (DUF106 family)